MEGKKLTEKTDGEEEKSHGQDDESELIPHSPTKAERQSSYCRKPTEEADVVEEKLNPVNDSEQEEESCQKNSLRMNALLDEVDEIKENEIHDDIQTSVTEETDEKLDNPETNRQDVTEEDDIRNMRTEEDTNVQEVHVEGHHVGPNADIMASKTVDDDNNDAKGACADFRGSHTIDEEAKEEQQSYQGSRKTKVIWKISDVRPHGKNADPVSKMIASLPSEAVVKGLGEWTVLGRGENVDVYLHDILSSRKHAKFRVIRDDRSTKAPRFVAELQNISDTKVITINGSREIRKNNVSEVLSNDQVAIGVFTFLIEIVPGELKSKQYEILFRNIIPSSLPMLGPYTPGNASPFFPTMPTFPGVPTVDWRHGMPSMINGMPVGISSMPTMQPMPGMPSIPFMYYNMPTENRDIPNRVPNRGPQENDENSGICSQEDYPAKEHKSTQP